MPTQAQLLSRVRLDPGLDTTAISDADVLTLMQEGAVDMAMHGDAFIKTVQWDSAASTQLYVLSGASAKVSANDFLEIYLPTGGLIYIDDNGDTRELGTDFHMTSERWLNRNIPSWQDDSASDTLEYVYLTYDSSGYLNLGVYPKSSTAITNAFKLWYKSRGTDMTGSNYPWTNSTTNLVHTEPFQKGIAFYALWQIHEIITKRDTEAKKWQEKYLVERESLRLAQERILTQEIQGSRDAAALAADQSFGRL